MVDERGGRFRCVVRPARRERRLVPASGRTDRVSGQWASFSGATTELWRVANHRLNCQLLLLTVAFPDRATPAKATICAWRRGPESNRRIEVLQTSALPLGYRAVPQAGPEAVCRDRGGQDDFPANRMGSGDIRPRGREGVRKAAAAWAMVQCPCYGRRAPTVSLRGPEARSAGAGERGASLCQSASARWCRMLRARAISAWRCAIFSSASRARSSRL